MNDTAVTKLEEHLKGFKVKMDHEQEKANNLSISIGLGAINPNASAQQAAASPSKNISALFRRFDKAKLNYYVNGTKIINNHKTLKSMEDELETVNFTMFTDRILRRITDDSVAKLP